MIEVAALVVALLSAATACWFWQDPRASKPAFRHQYSLRSLMILLTVGPPLCAAGWWHREACLQVLDKATSFSGRGAIAPAPAPATSSRASRGRAAALNASKQSELVARELHLIARAAVAILFLVTSLLLLGVVLNTRDWTRPPKPSPLLGMTIATSLLLAAAFFMLVATYPSPDRTKADSDRERILRHSVEIPLTSTEY